jgi:hypothetical protein
LSKRCRGDGQEPQKNPRLLGERLPRHQIAVVLQNRQQDFIACEEFEGEIGPRVVGNGVDVGTEQQIDIGTFYNEFIRPGPESRMAQMVRRHERRLPTCFR